MSEPENPYAFPTETGELYLHGMTLRDWFAGQALAGLIAHASGEDPHKAPSLAFKLADAMLCARLPQAALDALGGGK